MPAVASAIVACSSIEPPATDTPEEPTARVILIQGACSSSALNDVPNHWTNTVSNVLADSYGMVDLPAGHPDDQVIEFGYSQDGWDQMYLPQDTLRGVGQSSRGLVDIYAMYPDSEFFIVGHSLGGVVALDGLARYSDDDNALAARTEGVITVSSPVQGLNDTTAGVAGAAIEILVCRQLPQGGEPAPVWADMKRSGDSISLIHDANWSPVRVVNFANAMDRVVAPEIAVLESHFEVSCYDAGRAGLLQLNHDTLLSREQFARELLAVLIEGEEPKVGCESS